MVVEFAKYEYNSSADAVIVVLLNWFSFIAMTYHYPQTIEKSK